MQTTEKIAYRGKLFIVEWYFNERGSSPALNYYLNLSIERRVKLFKLICLLAENGKIFDVTKFRNEGDKIFAFKPQPDRFLCFFAAGRKVIITNAFEKKSQKFPAKEKSSALKAQTDFENRTAKGVYYE